MTSLDAFGKQDVLKIGLKIAAQGLSTRGQPSSLVAHWFLAGEKIYPLLFMSNDLINVVYI